MHSALQFPNAVVVNAVGHRNTQPAPNYHTKECSRSSVDSPGVRTFEPFSSHEFRASIARKSFCAILCRTRKRTQMRTKERKRKSAKGRKRAQKGAKGRKRAQKGAKERFHAKLKTTRFETTRFGNPQSAAFQIQERGANEVSIIVCWLLKLLACAVQQKGHRHVALEFSCVFFFSLSPSIRDDETTIKIKFAVLGGGGSVGGQFERGKSSKTLFFVGSATTIKF